MSREIYIHSIKQVLPPHHLPQALAVNWTIKAHKRCASLSGEGDECISDKLARFALPERLIRERYYECDEIDEEWEKHRIYKLTNESPQGATIKERNLFFSEKVHRVLDELYGEEKPHHIIHVTCTGYLSPSPVQSFFSDKKFPPDITHAYHMGCYAALPSVRMAMGLHMMTKNDIDILHTEMCSLHLNPTRHTPEQIVVETLFADGHIKYSIGSEKKGMKILTVKEQLVPDTQNDMTWIPDAYGMSMTLSKEVPFKIRDMVMNFVLKMCEESGLKSEKIFNEAIFAIHPGGPKIIDAIQKKLELRDEQVEMGRRVLFERGNMSSATLPHVWNEILLSAPAPGRKIISLAFGPGLTIFGSIFEVVE